MTTGLNLRLFFRACLYAVVVVTTFVLDVGFGYDRHNDTRVCDNSEVVTAYDAASLSATDEKRTEVLVDGVAFAKFTEFLAAKTLPELEISASKYPELAENILNAQKAGHPEILTHGGDIAANRATALEGVPNIKPFSRDEYPFASSTEGGAGTWVGHVPVSQQNAQGALLKNFFKANNIQPGDQYRVVIKP